MEQPNTHSSRRGNLRLSIWCLGGLWAGFAVTYIVQYLLRCVLRKPVAPEHEVILLAAVLAVMLIAGLLLGRRAERRMQRAAGEAAQNPNAKSPARLLAEEALLYLAINGGLGIAVAVLYHLEQTHHLTNAL